MTNLKATSLFLLGAVFTFSACGQTSSGTKAGTTGSTTTKTTTTTTKTVTTTPVKTTVVNKLPQAGTTRATVKTTTTTIKKAPAGSSTISKTTTAPAKSTQSAQPVQTTTTTTKTTTTTTGSGTSKTLPGAGTQTQTNTGINQRPGTKDVTPANNSTTNQTTNTQNGRGGANTTTNTTTDIINTITQGDAASAIKEALKKGVQVGVDKVSVTDGYFGNSMIKIPFPAQVKQVESALRSAGMGSLVDNAVLSMNRAAESAAKQAGPIFLNSITQMTVTDAVNIVSNKQPDAATQFLKRTTSESLVTSFKPSIKAALDKTLATKYWADITGYYNKIPFVTKISTDLPDYVTRKAVDGLFYMVAQEEAKIRKDPGGQANEIIKDVFGKVKF